MNDNHTDNETTAQMGRKPGCIVAVLILLIIGVFVVKAVTGKDKGLEEEPLYKAKSGPLTISITEAGRLAHKDEILIKNETDRSLKILSILDEGTVVTNGQLILELESESLEEKVDTAVLNVERIRSDLTAAQERREILRSQKQTNVDQARLNLKFAKLELEKAVKGLHPQQLETAMANVKTAEENLSQARDANHPQTRELAHENIKLTQENLEKTLNGTQPQDIESADAKVMIAEEQLERAQKDYTWSKKLHEKGFITLKELRADELAQKQAEINLSVAKTSRELTIKYTHPQEVQTLKRTLKNYTNDLHRLLKYTQPQDIDYLKRMLKIAKNDLNVLQTYTLPQKMEQLESDVKFNEDALDRAERSMKAELTGQMAEIIHHKAELERGTNNLIKVQERLKACKIYAPAEGMIIYATSGGSRHWERERIEVGATVHPMHTIIRMPTNNIMIAEFSIQEATKPKISKGMPVTLSIEAMPDEIFAGKIIKIGILPDSTQAWLNPDLKVYACEVQLDEFDPRFKPGMSCSVNIVLEEHEDALSVPIQCVLKVDGKPTVYVKKGKKSKSRTVQTGLDDNVYVHIISGLEDGETVLMNPPLDEAEKKNGNGHQNKNKQKTENR